MKVLQLACLLTLVVTLVGCGQKYPESYGLYVRNGQAWVPADSTKPNEVSEKPEFLIFDSRLARSSEKPDVTITIRPMKWIRWNINALVAERNAGARFYEKSKAGSFLPAETSFKMSYSPVKNRPDMLIASPAAPIADGYFVLEYFDDKVICRRNVPLNPAELPESHVVDKWSVSHDENAGFSWDAFLAQSANSGRAVFNEGYEPPQKLVVLLDDLRQELEALVKAKSSPPILSFCKKVERLDPDLYALARKECLGVIEAEIGQAKDNHDLPVAIGIGVMATNAGFSSDLILKELVTCTSELNAIEAASAKATGELMADRTHAGKRGSIYELDRGYSLAETSVAVEDSHIFYSTRLMAYPEEQNRIWMGNIASFSKAEDISVDIDADYPLNRRDKFSSVADQNRFYAEASKAFENWKEKWRSRLTVEVTARPYYWSERVFVYDLPFSMECLEGSDGIIVADVDLGADDETASRSKTHRRFDGNAKSYNTGQSWGEPGISGGFRVKSTGQSPVKLRIRFCPAVGLEVSESQESQPSLAQQSSLVEESDGITRSDTVVAKVNGTSITEGDVQKVLKMFLKQMGEKIPPDQMEAAMPRIRERIVEELIMRNVMLAEVARQGIILSDTEIEELKVELAKELPAGTTYESYMAESGITESEMRQQMATRKMILAKAGSVARPADMSDDLYAKKQQEVVKDYTASLRSQAAIQIFDQAPAIGAKSSKTSKSQSSIANDPVVTASARSQVEQNYIEEGEKGNGLKAALVGRGWSATASAELSGIPKNVAFKRIKANIPKSPEYVLKGTDRDAGTIEFEQPLSPGRKLGFVVQISPISGSTGDSCSVSIRANFLGGMTSKKEDIIVEFSRLMDVAGGLIR